MTVTDSTDSPLGWMTKGAYVKKRVRVHMWEDICIQNVSRENRATIVTTEAGRQTEHKLWANLEAKGRKCPRWIGQCKQNDENCEEGSP